MKTVTLTEIHRHFTQVLRVVAQGQSVVVTSRGKPVAMIAPTTQRMDLIRERAKKRLLDRLRAIQPSGSVHGWARDDLYD